MMNLYVKSYPTSLPNYIFIEVVLKSYLDKLYFHKLYDELMHQNCAKSYLKNLRVVLKSRMMNLVRKNLNDELVYKNFCKRNLPDKDNILQVMSDAPNGEKTGKGLVAMKKRGRA